MQTWDKIYINIKELLSQKKRRAQSLWSIAHILNNPSSEYIFWDLWRTEIHHAIGLNKLLQSLGYSQIKLMEKNSIGIFDIGAEIEQIIADKEKWLPILEKISEETFGNEIHYTLLGILTDDLVSIEKLKDFLTKTSRHSERCEES
ncbi:MAG: hypothetical protein VR72_10840 [Clostridiaceae bacterium BRH_c20a]|nr:MAG: hypothetical protein VR72_10840 [Clostridiaceae bacterium BRH_c20a]